MATSCQPSKDIQCAYRSRRDENDSAWIKQVIRVPIAYSPDEEDKTFRHETIGPGVLHSIGHGIDGIVLAAKFTKGNQVTRVAMKRFNVLEMKRLARTGRGFTKLFRELQNTLYLQHPNIVQAIDHFYEIDSGGRLQNVWLVTERMDASLQYYFDGLRKPQADGKPKLRDHRHMASLFVQLFRALDYLEMRGIMHRDLNPKNVGMNRKDFVLKIIDFGGCGAANSAGDHTKTVAIPPIYRPLEVILLEKYDCSGGFFRTVDVWAVGLIALEFLGTKLMMPHLKKIAEKEIEDGVKRRILDVLGVPEDKHKVLFGDALKDFDPSPSRLDEELEMALETVEPDRQWLAKKDLKALLTKIFVVNPQQRLRPSMYLNEPYLQKINEKLHTGLPNADDIAAKNARDEKLLLDMLSQFSKSIQAP